MNIKFTLPIKPRTKKNTPMILWRKQPFQIKIGKVTVANIPYTPFIAPSAGYSDFENDSLPYFYRVKQEVGVVNYPVNIQCIFYMDARRKVDLSNLLNAVDDAMVKSGLILDDNRDIIAGHDGSRVYHDNINPRIELEIKELKDYVQWKDTKNSQTSLF